MNETLTYDADPATVFAMLCDKRWRERVCEAMHAVDHTVTMVESGDRVTVTTKRTMPAMVPEAVRRVTGDTITITQVEQWGPAATDGSRVADLQVSIAGQPAGMRGNVRLTPAGNGSTHAYRGDVKVNLPFLGKKIEPELVKAIRAAIRKEGDVGRAHLAT